MLLVTYFILLYASVSETGKVSRENKDESNGFDLNYDNEKV